MLLLSMSQYHCLVVELVIIIIIIATMSVVYVIIL